MSTTKSVTIKPPDKEKSITGQEYLYDIRLEIGVKDASGTIPVAAIFRTLITKLKEAADYGKPATAQTIDNMFFQEDTEFTGEEFKNAFCVETIEGKSPKVLLGFKLKTMTPLSTLKHRIMRSHLIPNDLYLKEHHGGFDHGVKRYTYGFLKDEHPEHPNHHDLYNRFIQLMTDAWTHLPKDEQSRWKTTLPNAVKDNIINIPLYFEKDRISAIADDKPKITTTALTITTPHKFSPLVRSLFDTMVLSKSTQNMIPFALGRENAAGYYNIIASQTRFMEQHRNIQVLYVPEEFLTQLGNHDQTLEQVLLGHPAIKRVTHETTRDRYHISTTATHYRTVIHWVDQILRKHNFQYQPKVVKPKPGPTSSQYSKYSTVFSEVMSETNDSYDASTIKSTRSPAWKTRPPIDISYILNNDTFPPLPKASTRIINTPTTTTEPTEQDKIPSAISEALKQLEAQHRAELEEFKFAMEAKIADIETQMKELGQTVAIQTYKALVHEDSPLVTKIEHTKLQQEIRIISTQLTTIMQHLKLICDSESPDGPNKPSTPDSPTRITKRSKPSNTPERPKTRALTKNQSSSSSATSSPDTEMEGCER